MKKKRKFSSSQDGEGSEDDGEWVVDAERKQFSEWRNEDFSNVLCVLCFMMKIILMMLVGIKNAFLIKNSSRNF